MKTYKCLPYSNSDLKSIITENYAYIDKTRYIEMLENNCFHEDGRSKYSSCMLCFSAVSK
ncbi:MAG: hypothetical protein LBM08_07545 [Dysgonamonadaceae bacterium]|nr:hypothetical protein [Dysgonamonadaceae bacterium]